MFQENKFTNSSIEVYPVLKFWSGYQNTAGKAIPGNWIEGIIQTTHVVDEDANQDKIY